jgi:hypothetical protein
MVLIVNRITIQDVLNFQEMSRLAHHIITQEGTDRDVIFLDTLSEPPEFKGGNVCLYCKSSLLINKLCMPCKELYRMHFIRCDCGVYVKNTAKQRSDILSDELNENPI